MTPLLYSLHSGNLYGTERMALATVQGLAGEFEPVIVAPDGPVHREASRIGLRTICFTTPARYLADLRPLFSRHKEIVSIGTRVLHTAAAELMSRLYRRSCANIQVVHGGADEILSYGRKRWLNYLGSKQVAVSKYVKDRLMANGSHPASVRVIENFLTRECVANAPRRKSFDRAGIRKIAIVSRLDPIKRIDLLFSALDVEPRLREFSFEIYGSGSEEQNIRLKALTKYPQVHLAGFRGDVAARVAEADLLLHLCPVEPFGLAILEAMAARVPVLVPDSGGAGDIVEHGRNGFRFRANNSVDLASQLLSLSQAPAERLRNVVHEGWRSLHTRFSAEAGIAQYRKLIHECLS